jgi:hypothetical protein
MHQCQATGGTASAERYANTSERVDVVPTCHLILVTQGTSLIEHPLCLILFWQSEMQHFTLI